MDNKNKFWKGVMVGVFATAFVCLVTVGASIGIYMFGRQILLRAGSGQGGSGQEASSDEAASLDMNQVTGKLGVILDLINEVYLFDTDPAIEEAGIYKGLMYSLGDLYADYYTPEEMTALLQGADLCVDATHPYAVEATRNIRAACKTAGTEYRRLLRPESPLPAGSMVFASAVHAAGFLARTQGNVLLATGAKELSAFAVLEPARLFPRVLPTREGIAACEGADIPHKNIIAMQGPFSYALNRALMEQFAIRFLVTKDGGAAGGFEEKARAAQDTGAQLIVIRRPAEQGETAEQILTHCKEMLQ